MKDKKMISWCCWEYLGAGIMRIPDDLQEQAASEDIGLLREMLLSMAKDFPNHKVTDRGGIVVGDYLLCPNITGRWSLAKVSKVEGEKAEAVSGDTIYALDFGKDDRNCWVCIGSANLRAVRKLELFRTIKVEEVDDR